MSREANIHFSYTKPDQWALLKANVGDAWQNWQVHSRDLKKTHGQKLSRLKSQLGMQGIEAGSEEYERIVSGAQAAYDEKVNEAKGGENYKQVQDYANGIRDNMQKYLMGTVKGHQGHPKGGVRNYDYRSGEASAVALQDWIKNGTFTDSTGRDWKVSQLYDQGQIHYKKRKGGKAGGYRPLSTQQQAENQVALRASTELLQQVNEMSLEEIVGMHFEGLVPEPTPEADRIRALNERNQRTVAPGVEQSRRTRTPWILGSQGQSPDWVQGGV